MTWADSSSTFQSSFNLPKIGEEEEYLCGQSMDRTIDVDSQVILTGQIAVPPLQYPYLMLLHGELFMSLIESFSRSAL